MEKEMVRCEDKRVEKEGKSDWMQIGADMIRCASRHW